MSAFSEKGLLGELEQLVLLASLHLEDPYAVSIRDEIESRSGIALTRTSVYVALDRLDRKGYMTSWFGDPTPERGGRAKRYFRIEPLGMRALRQTERELKAMWDGIDLKEARRA